MARARKQRSILMISNLPLSLISVLFFLIPTSSVAAPPDDFTVFVNNSLVHGGNSVFVPSASTVYFVIRQSSNLPIHLDPTGHNDIDYSLSGNLAHFATAYSEGTYNPTIKVGNKTQKIQLIVDHKKVDMAGWFTLISSFISGVSWQLLAFIVFIVLFYRGGLRTLLLNIKPPTKVQIGSITVEASDLSAKMTAALENTINSIERKIPPALAARFLPSSVGSDIAYDIHVVEYLNSVAAYPGNTNTWNAVGNYYFAHDLSKAENAYNKAIECNGNDPNAYANLGMLYLMRKKDHHTSKRFFTTALEVADKIHTTCATAHMGMVVLSHGNDVETEKLHCEEAKRVFERAVTKDNTDFWSLSLLGWCWSYGDPNLDKAIEYVSRGLEYAQDFYAAQYNMACFYALKNDALQSVQALKAIVRRTARQTFEVCNFEKDNDWNNVASNDEFTQFCDFMGLSYQIARP